jgi:hypothetical protein
MLGAVAQCRGHQHGVQRIQHGAAAKMQRMCHLATRNLRAAHADHKCEQAGETKRLGFLAKGIEHRAKEADRNHRQKFQPRIEPRVTEDKADQGGK